MSTTTLLLAIWIGATLAQTAAWAWQRRAANANIVDAVWSSTVAASALLAAAVGDGAVQARIALAVLGGAWGLRLARHLWARVGEAEDGRYRYLRDHWQGHQGKFFVFFQAQALLAPLFALPFVVAADSPQTTLWPWIALAVAIWAIAVAGETVADRQLTRFRADPGNRGGVCRDGLWRYSRHPNYFFEWLHWFAYVALAVGAPLWWLTWAGPVVMYVFLRYLSGVPWTERQSLRSRGEAYRDYQRTTSMFFPWPPRRKESA